MTQITPVVPTPGPAADTAPIAPTITPLAAAPAPVPVTPAVPAAPTPVVPDANAVTPIDDEQVPLAVDDENQDDTDNAENSEITNIEDEATPLAAEPECKVHWYEAVLTAVFAAYQGVRMYARNKKIKNLEDEQDSNDTLGKEK